MEAPDEAAHSGSLKDKIQAIERFDSLIVGAIRKQMDKLCDYKIMALSDHATPLSLRTHTNDPVPVAIYDSRNMNKTDNAFSEACAKDSGICIDPGWKLMEYFLGT